MQFLHHGCVTWKRRTWLILLACVAVAITLFALLPRNSEPRYEGRTLSGWISADPYISRSETRKEIDTIGTNAIPHLLQWITYDYAKSPGHRLGIWTFKALPYSFIQRVPGLQETLLMDDRFGRAEAVPEVFQALGPVATPAIPELQALLSEVSDPSVFGRVLGSLGAISTNAAPLVLEHLAGPDEARRIGAMNAYANYDLLITNAEPAVPLVLHSLQNATSKNERMMALFVLYSISVPPELVVGPLTAALSDPSPDVVSLARKVLQHIAPEVLTNTPPE